MLHEAIRGGVPLSGKFLDTPAEFEKRRERLIEHFRHGEAIFFAKRPKGIPTARDVLWFLLQDAMHTARNTPFTELRQVSAVRTVMPGARVSTSEAFALRRSRLESGMEEFDDKPIRPSISEADRDRMVDVLDLLRLVRGQNADRMRRTCLARAAGLSLEQCGRIWDRHRLEFDRRAMHDIRSRVVGQVLQGIENELGLVRTSRGFRRLTMREIEKNRRRRKREEAADAG